MKSGHFHPFWALIGCCPKLPKSDWQLPKTAQIWLAAAQKPVYVQKTLGLMARFLTYTSILGLTNRFTRSEPLTLTLNFILLCLIIYIPTGSQAYMLSILILLGLALFLQHWTKPFVTSLENWIEQFSIMSFLVLHVATQYGTLIDTDRSYFVTPTLLFIISYIGFSLIVFGIAGIVCYFK